MRAHYYPRSLHTSYLSQNIAHVNVPGGLAATPLATRAPGRENRRYAIPSAYPFRLPGRA